MLVFHSLPSYILGHETAFYCLVVDGIQAFIYNLKPIGHTFVHSAGWPFLPQGYRPSVEGLPLVTDVAAEAHRAV